MINSIQVYGEQPFQVPVAKFAVESESGYDLYVSVSGNAYDIVAEEVESGVKMFDAGVGGLYFQLIGNYGTAIIRY